MTVESVNGEGVFCIWFTNGRLECFKFDAVVLEKEVTLDDLGRVPAPETH